MGHKEDIKEFIKDMCYRIKKRIIVGDWDAYIIYNHPVWCCSKEREDYPIIYKIGESLRKDGIFERKKRKKKNGDGWNYYISKNAMKLIRWEMQ